MNMNSIMLQKKLKVVLEKGNMSRDNNQHIATLLKNVEVLGFTLSPEVIDVLTTFDNDEMFESFYTEVVDVLKEMVGAHVEHKPMYPNFPKEVMEMEDSKLYLNAIMHYMTGELPEVEGYERPEYLDELELKVINLGTSTEFFEMVGNIIAAKTSISDDDKAIINYTLGKHKRTMLATMPDDIHMKENMVYVSKLLFENYDTIHHKWFKTATDILRLSVGLSNGDISLAGKTKFKSFKRSQRRMMLGLLDKIKYPQEDMLRYKDKWLRLGEVLHPGDYTKKFPNAFKAFSDLRNGVKISTFQSKVEKALLDKDVEKAVKLLEKRPGEFARRLDHLLRIANVDPQQVGLVVSSFGAVASDVATPVLSQLLTHFKHRSNDEKFRVFFPKGSVARAYGLEQKLDPIDDEYCDMVVSVVESVLVDKFKELEPLGKVYLDENLKNHIVPFSQRSASKAIDTLTRGSRIPFSEDAEIVRAFIHWKNLKGDAWNARIDIDLSVGLYNDDWQFVGQVSFTHLRSTKHGITHSGDITNAPNGASEFIDINMTQARAAGVRYVVPTVYSYSQHNLCDTPECFMGIMEREHADRGKVFEAKSVTRKVNLATEATTSLPMVLDLGKGELVWADMGFKSRPGFANTLEGNLNTVQLVGKSLTETNKMNMYDLLELHVKARGTLVDNLLEENEYEVDKETLEMTLVNSTPAPDYVFISDKDFRREAEEETTVVTPYDIDVIAAQFL